jgi:D-glycero-D-manno-heptose 1,7-bisphosphate phosphatase
MKAASELDIDLEQSWMVGDRGSDIECGHSAGCRTILIGDGYKEIFRTLPNFQAQSLHEAVTIILN